MYSAFTLAVLDDLLLTVILLDVNSFSLFSTYSFLYKSYAKGLAAAKSF